MQKYIVRRLLLFIPVLIGVSLIIFLLMRVVPGDIALLMVTSEVGTEAGEKQLQDLRHKLGTDRPVHVQYFSWVWGLLRLDAGTSFWTGRPVAGEIGRGLPVTIELAVLAVVLSWIIAVPIGVLSAIKQDTWIDYAFRVVTIGGVSMPEFWAAIVIILVLSVYFGWIPPLGYANFVDDPLKNLSQMTWPALTLGYRLAALLGRMTRSTMLEVLREDYVRTAWAKGLPGKVVMIRHALRNALLPVITVSGGHIGFLLGGAVVLEVIFSLPGLGRTLIAAIFHRDYPLIQGIVVLMAFVFSAVNLAVDLTYAWLDPRIRYA